MRFISTPFRELRRLWLTLFDYSTSIAGGKPKQLNKVTFDYRDIDESDESGADDTVPATTPIVQADENLDEPLIPPPINPKPKSRFKLKVRRDCTSSRRNLGKEQSVPNALAFVDVLLQGEPNFHPTCQFTSQVYGFND